MLVTELGIDTDVTSLHSQNALSPILVTESPITIVRMLWEPHFGYTLEQLYIGPEPVIVKVPLESTDQVRLSPQVPLVSSAASELSDSDIIAKQQMASIATIAANAVNLTVGREPKRP